MKFLLNGHVDRMVGIAANILGHRENNGAAAKKTWNSTGIVIPETVNSVNTLAVTKSEFRMYTYQKGVFSEKLGGCKISFIAQRLYFVFLEKLRAIQTVLPDAIGTLCKLRGMASVSNLEKQLGAPPIHSDTK